jgi:hypothetical protein
MAQHLTEVESFDLHVAKRELEVELYGRDYSRQRAVQILLDIIERLTTEPPLPCRKCGSCLDCLILERDCEGWDA